MPVYSSDLPNDQDLIRALGSIAVPCPMRYGDVFFWGISEDASGADIPLRVTVERKKIGDLAACIINGRYMYQAQKAKEAGADVLVLIAETGHIRANPDDGMIDLPVWGTNPDTGKRTQIWQQLQPVIAYSRFDQFLTELDWIAGIIVKRSFDVTETANIIRALYDNFQTAPSKHNSLKQMYKAGPPVVQLVTPGLVRRVAAELSGVGWTRSGSVADKFPTVRAMVEASVQDWLSIPGIGKKTAEKAVSSLNGRL